MTTIAYRDGIMATDSHTAFCGYTGDVGIKCRRYERDGNVALVGFAGELGLILAELFPAFERWANAAGVNPLTPHIKPFGEAKFDDVNGMVAYRQRDGKTGIFYLNVYGCFLPVPARHHSLEGRHAIGSGADYALGALAMGATAVEAVKVSRMIDVNTRGTIWYNGFDADVPTQEFDR